MSKKEKEFREDLISKRELRGMELFPSHVNSPNILLSARKERRRPPYATGRRTN